GNVARRFVSLVAERDAALVDLGIRTRVVAIATGRHGCVSSPEGLDAASLAHAVTAGGDVGPRVASTQDFLAATLQQHAASARDGRLVVVETTTLDIRAGEPAVSHVRAALGGGAHVVTANKGPAAFAYRALA